VVQKWCMYTSKGAVVLLLLQQTHGVSLACCIRRTDNIFKQLDERSLTAEEERIIQQRVCAHCASLSIISMITCSADCLLPTLCIPLLN
jgi:hypothetical protein